MDFKKIAQQVAETVCDSEAEPAEIEEIIDEQNGLIAALCDSFSWDRDYVARRQVMEEIEYYLPDMMLGGEEGAGTVFVQKWVSEMRQVRQVKEGKEVDEFSANNRHSHSRTNIVNFTRAQILPFLKDIQKKHKDADTKSRVLLNGKPKTIQHGLEVVLKNMLYSLLKAISQDADAELIGSLLKSVSMDEVDATYCQKKWAEIELKASQISPTDDESLKTGIPQTSTLLKDFQQLTGEHEGQFRKFWTHFRTIGEAAQEGLKTGQLGEVSLINSKVAHALEHEIPVWSTEFDQTNINGLIMSLKSLIKKGRQESAVHADTSKEKVSGPVAATNQQENEPTIRECEINEPSLDELEMYRYMMPSIKIYNKTLTDGYKPRPFKKGSKSFIKYVETYLVDYFISSRIEDDWSTKIKALYFSLINEKKQLLWFCRKYLYDKNCLKQALGGQEASWLSFRRVCQDIDKQFGLTNLLLEELDAWKSLERTKKQSSDQLVENKIYEIERKRNRLALLTNSTNSMARINRQAILCLEKCIIDKDSLKLLQDSEEMLTLKCRYEFDLICQKLIKNERYKMEWNGYPSSESEDEDHEPDSDNETKKTDWIRPR